MQKYISVKLVEVEPMTRGEYNEHRGWTPPEGEDQEVAGYHVVYADGYESWTPAPQFEEASVAVPAGKDAGQAAADIRRILNEMLFA